MFVDNVVVSVLTLLFPQQVERELVDDTQVERKLVGEMCTCYI